MLDAVILASVRLGRSGTSTDATLAKVDPPLGALPSSAPSLPWHRQ